MTEAQIEQITLDIFQNILEYDTTHASILGNERQYTDVILRGRLEEAITRINPKIPKEARKDALKQVQRIGTGDLLIDNETFHTLLTDGVDVKYSIGNGQSKTDKVWLVDWSQASNNQFLAVQQMTITENHNTKRPDIVVFINGLPLVVIELKNPIDENAGVIEAFNQLQTYKQQISSLFTYNAFLVISDYWFAKIGTISSNYNRFMEWKSEDGHTIIDSNTTEEMPVLLKGVFSKDKLLDIIGQFIVFERTKEKTIKKIAAYHQYYAVNKAINSTLKASIVTGDKRAGVVWHTQGSGKSLSMLFYTGKLVLTPEMENPTIIVLTDRNDLDQQLFETFSNCSQLLRQKPKQAESRTALRELLSVASGGVIFTTIQKFLPEEKGDTYPELSQRRNIVIIADEAHRSQYDFIDGFARNMRDALPNASFIGFTGTPIEKEDANTQSVFGEYVDIYDIKQAVDDGATVRIYFESRLAKVRIKDDQQKIIDERVEEISESEELTERQKRFVKWSSKEAVVGSKERLEKVANDIVKHFEAREKASLSKAMVVCMSRRICIALHNEIIKIRPEWYDKEDDRGNLKVIMTGSASDPLEWQEHIRNNPRRKIIGDRLKDPKDQLKIVIVRDMWLTGFDAPCLNTLYIDKQMNGHNLMQAIARVNRVFGEKDGGLIVDYIGIAQDLKNALAVYTENRGRGQLTFDIDEAVAKMQEFYEILCDMFENKHRHYFDLPLKDKYNYILDATNHILGLKDGKNRFKFEVTRLSRIFALVAQTTEAIEIRDDLAFFQAIKARIVKLESSKKERTDVEIETAIRQIIDDAIISTDVIDIFDAAGMKSPDISILSEEFLNKIRNLSRKNLGLELLKRLLNDEIKMREATNIIQGKRFSEMLTNAVRKYQNGLIDSVQVIEELIELAKKIKETDKRGEKLNLRVDELAFYDALTENPSIETFLSDETLKKIAHELVENIRKNVTLDWQIKESVQATLRNMVKRILRKYKYPPDDPKTGEYTVSIQRVLDQTERSAKNWL